ncbi:MAG: CBS domain-containing protein [Pseudomonadota bacterium]
MYFEDQTAVSSGHAYAQDLLADPLEEFLTWRSLQVCRPDDTVSAGCAKLGAERHAILLIVAHEVVVGVVSQGDIVRSLARGCDPSEIRLAQVMSRNPHCVSVSASVGDALSIMVDESVNSLPVISDGRVQGVLSYRDIPAQYHWAYDMLDHGTLPLPAHAIAN